MTMFLHGFSGGPPSFDRLFALLPAQQRDRAFAPALLGHGVDDPSVATFWDEADRLARELGARASHPTTLVGYSLGGRLAFGIACRHPALVARVVAIGAHPGLVDRPSRAARAQADERWAALLEREGIDAFADAWEAQPVFASRARLPAERTSASYALRRAHDPHGLARSLRLTGLGAMPPLEDLLAACALPIDLVVGAEDSARRRVSEDLVGVLPTARLTVVPSVGHDVLLERPAALVPVLS